MSADEPANLTDYDRKLIEAYQAFREAGTEHGAARLLGLNRTTLTNRLLRYFLRGLDGRLPAEPMPGHIVKSVSAQYDSEGRLRGQHIKTVAASSDDPYKVPDGHRIKGESALVDTNGNVIQRWVKTTEGKRSEEALYDAARLAAETYAGPAAPIGVSIPKPGDTDPDRLNLHLLPDLHIGMHADKVRADIDWSLAGSIEIYRRLFRTLMERAPAARTGIILGGGDLLHFDDPMKRTRGHGNALDGAESYATVLAAAENLMVYKVELALQRYERVVVRILEGNHDPDSSVAVAHYLKAWFRNEPRVEVDIDPSVFWFFEFGKVMLAATHGHETAISKMPGIMAADRPAMWGRTAYRYAHGFHIHHKTQSAGEEGGASWETHNTPVPRDDHHQNRGYRSARLLVVPSYHRETGFKGAVAETLT